MRIIILLSLLTFAISIKPAQALQATITLTSPVPFQVFQRHGGTADIRITGQVNAAGTIEARFNGGEWHSVAPIRSGAFSGVLAGQPQGQGALEVRVAEAPEITLAIPWVGIGDVFVVAGQSNASGRGYTLHTAAHPYLKGSIFGNNYAWRELADPVDSSAGQVDAISGDPDAGGSVWALIGTHLMNARNIPVAFVPAARGGSSIADWTPPSSRFNRSTLYGSMAHRARTTGAKAVLWWQGEIDALENMSQAEYAAQFGRLASAIQSDLGIPIIPVLIHNSMAIPDDAEAAIRRAVIEAAQTYSAIRLGPDLSDLASDDQYHLLSDANMQAAAERWWGVLQSMVE
jgi:sialate O-acetylesterase